MIHQDSFTVTTRGRGTYEVTQQIRRIVAASNITTGLCHVFVHHTSASLMLCENADPTVRQDLRHTLEGPDDMPAHIRTVLTQTGLAIPIHNAGCDLGTWQGVYLWEHRNAGHTRRLTVTAQGA
jgi:secondary thiamine-phosphate synthase enzyme